MNHFSDDFEMCGMMISNEKMNTVFSGKFRANTTATPITLWPHQDRAT